MTITWPMIAWAIGILGAWSGVLLGAIKYLLGRQLAAFETKVADADAKAGKALSGQSEHKQAVANDIAALRLEFERKSVCSNHQRMEVNDKDLFVRLDSLHGDIRELCGGVKGLANSLDMVNQHLLNGGK